MNINKDQIRGRIKEAERQGQGSRRQARGQRKSGSKGQGSKGSGRSSSEVWRCEERREGLDEGPLISATISTGKVPAVADRRIEH